MTAFKFEVGQKVVVVVPPLRAPHLQNVVTQIEDRVIKEDGSVWYGITDYQHGRGRDYCFRAYKPPADPVTWSSVEQICGWNPTKREKDKPEVHFV